MAWGSAWAWFGTTVGATCWLLLSSVLLTVRGHPLVAVVFLLCFALPTWMALRLWKRRDRLHPYAALEAWFVVAWVAAIAAIAAAHLTDTHAEINLPGDQIWTMWIVILLAGPLLWVATRRARRRRGEGVAGGLFDVLASLI